MHMHIQILRIAYAAIEYSVMLGMSKPLCEVKVQSEYLAILGVSTANHLVRLMELRNNIVANPPLIAQ